MAIFEPINDPVERYLMRLNAESSRNTATAVLTQCANLLGFESYDQVPWDKFEASDLLELIRMMNNRGLASNTINLRITMLRQVMSEALDIGMIEYSQFSAIGKVRLVPGGARNPGRCLSKDEIRRMFDSCAGGSLKDRRDKAMMATLFVGLRNSEVRSLKDESVLFPSKEIYVEGKGNKYRRVPTPQGLLVELNKWLEIKAEENKAGGYLLSSVKHKKVWNYKLDEESLRAILSARARIAGVEHHTPHDWRRTTVTTLYNAMVPIPIISAIVGHSNVRTTMLYYKYLSKEKEEAIEKHLYENIFG